ncbi:MAG: ATP-dependent DNA helicase RecG [Bacilli bacterium]|nr:ATP-dependent DNA helicase RecG [Bacilli bacterium]
MDLSEITFLTAKKVQTFKKAGINTVEDMLYHYPSRFEDYTITNYCDVEIGKTLTIAGIAQGKATIANVKSNLSVMNFYVDIDGNKIRVTIFNRHFLKSQIFYGKYVRLTGKFDGRLDHFIASEIAFDELSNAINPIFNIKGVDDKKVLEIKERLYYDYSYLLEEDLPDDLLKKYDLIGIKKAVRYINIPESMEETSKAIKRLKFEELLKFELKVKYMLYMRKNAPEGVSIDYDKDKVNNFINSLPYKLTSDQEKCLNDILGDVSSTYKMNRLLQGEVGSGKTVVAAIALYAITTAGYQGAIMVPTEVLAFQHYKTFSDFFANSEIKVALLTSSITGAAKKEILDDLENGNINIVIGTHSLIQKEVFFKKLGLVVTDEEHRFGVRQRVSMVGKGYLIDHLKMSATPIPRTLAISILGDSDISTIKVMPGNRKEVITKYLDYTHLQEVLNFIGGEVKKGRQAYIIAPMIDESDVMELQNAIDVYNRVEKFYDGFCNVGLIHGKLKTEEKDEIMRKFASNEYQILVATSVIEVGVNVINATTIAILDADRFGIAQLHQMRGRVRRSDYQAYCFLLSDSTVETAIKRLKLIEEVGDGFILAEEDLIMRGGGEIFGEKQSGFQTFKLADLLVDKDVLEVANKEAQELIDSGNLFSKEYARLLKLADDNYQSKKEIIE